MTDLESRNPSVKKKDSKACRQTKHLPLSHSIRGNAVTRSCSKTLWSYYSDGNVKLPEICVESLTKQCAKEKEGCSRLHANQPWHWQLLHEKKWYNFIHTQSDVLERAFQKVDTVEVVIPSLNPSKTGKIGQGLLLILGTDCWKADFNAMKIKRKGSDDTIQIRRLATPSSAKFKNKFSTDYTWFIQRNLKWVEFDQYFENLDDSLKGCLPVRSETVSGEIENKYQKNQRASTSLSLLSDEFIINFSKMECQSKLSKETVPVRRRPKPCNVSYPAIWSRQIQDSDLAEICTDGAWPWQVLHNDIWYGFPKVQSKVLERAYLDMWQDSVEIPGLNLAKMGNSGEILSTVLGTSKWLAKFDSMTITKLKRQGITLEIRRLSPPSTDTSDLKNPSKFVWFYKNEENIWLEFGYVDMKNDTSQLSSQTVSDQIEEVFLSNKEDAMDVTAMDSVCKLSFSEMTLSNYKTQKIMAVRRRPQCARSNSISARALDIIPLSEASKEYYETTTCLLSSLSEPKITNIKRFQNPEQKRVFWKRQNEVSVLLGTAENVNILTLFHWVKKRNVENIHMENLRHRHQCPEVKKISGKGVCFYKNAEFRHKSCSAVPSTKNHRLLLFEVIIRETKETKEDASDSRSPTLVDGSNMAEVFYICDKRDYCPTYVIEF